MKYLIHVVIPLSVGILIYLLSRSNNLIVYKWVPLLSAFPKFRGLPIWVKCNLPDGLWLYSLTTLMIFIWQKKLNLNSVGWIFAGLIIAIIIEFAQKFGYFPGTFDWMDIIFYFIAVMIAMIHLISFNKFKFLLTISAKKQVLNIK